MSDSPHYVDKAVRLFTFLAKAQLLRQAPVSDIDAYRRDGAVHWLGDLPDAHAVRWGVEPGQAWDQGPLLSVDRLIPSDPPRIPTSLDGWITGDALNPTQRPVLAEWRPAPDGPQRSEDHPEVAEAFDAWSAKWDAWAEVTLREQPVRDAYAELFKLYVQTTQKSEELELLLGVGLLAWAPEGHERMRRHLFTVPVIPKLEESNGRLDFFLDEGSVGMHVELDMLDPSLIPDQSLVGQLETRGHDFTGNPLDAADIEPLGRTVALQLHAEGRWDDAAALPTSHEYPTVAWAPALVLRPRNRTGLVQAFQDIAAQIDAAQEVPAGLLPLIDPDRLPPVTEVSTPGAILTFDDEVVAPLPLNDVQRRILERVDRHAQTLVQGPPGTGKTHTAAALLTHLLAQGQRVLVTAHTDRALREVRTKLPAQIKPLAVSVIGASRDDLADLRTAVDHISRRAGDNDEHASALRIQQLADQAAQLDKRRRALSRGLVDARSHEVAELSHGAYSGTFAAIAQRYQAEAGQHGWIADFVGFTPDSASPLSDDEALEWLALLRDRSLGEDAVESSRRRIPSATVLDADTFAAHVRAESEAEAKAAPLAEGPTHESRAALRALPVEQRMELRQRLAEHLTMAADLARLPLQWIDDALAAVRGGTGDIWRARASELATGIGRIDAVLEHLPAGVRVELPGDMDRMHAMATALERHLVNGGALKTRADGTVKIGAFTPGVVKECREVLEQARVDGLPPTKQADLRVLMAHRDASGLLDELDRAWPSAVDIPEEDTPRERVEWHRSQLSYLVRVVELGDRIRAEDEFLRRRGIVPPAWSDGASVERLTRTIDAIDAADAVAAARGPLNELGDAISTVAGWSDAAEPVHRLSHAVEARDHEGYARALARLVRLEQVSEATTRRDTLTHQVRTTAPALAEAVLTSPDDDAWDSRLAHQEAAFGWGAVGAWVLAQDQVDANSIQAQISVADHQLRTVAENIAAERAWGHAVGSERLTPGRRADLRSYSQQVSRLGKGTGKYAAQQRAEIRRAMERCRPAVPVWIMPLYRVAEQFRMQENMFDVVVVDEASQAGLEATFLQYLAPKIVVIGDDKQVSPAAVGVDQQQLRDLAAQYLHDDRYKDTWQDPQRSLFDEAAMRYGGQLTLVEHRRCVPEIIGFSNRIAYEPNGIRLIPVRQFGSDRLAPFVVTHVPDGAEEGTTGKINRAEARALVDDLKACLDDPAFENASLAVISLVGDRQAKYIESLLLAEIPAEEWARRSLRVGTAPDFQGSERDVVFLSMVSAVEPGRRLGALTREMYVQRFNVAVSRAKDQVRLFHSISLGELPNAEDLRFQLLDYAYGVAGRITSDGEVASSVVPEDERVEPFDSLFEQRIHNRIVDRGYTVVPQMEALGYRLDLVVVGARARLAVECDGDTWHGPEAYERDLARQRELERCGWRFFRVRESAFYVDPAAALAPLWDELDKMGIRPSGWVDDGVEIEGADAAQEFELDPPEPEGVGEFMDDLLEPSDAAQEFELELPEMAVVEEVVGVFEADDGAVEAEDPEPVFLDHPDAEPEVIVEESDPEVEADPRALSEEAPLAETDEAGSETLGAPIPETDGSDETTLYPELGANLHLALDRGRRGVPSSAPAPAQARRSALGVTWDPLAQLGGSVDAIFRPPAGLDRYRELDGSTVPVGEGTSADILDGLLRVVAVEGPVRGNRLRTAYVRASGGSRVGKAIAQVLNSAIYRAEKRGLLVGDDPLGASGVHARTYRLPEQPEFRVRELGPRTLDEVPPRELVEVMRRIRDANPAADDEQLLRETLRLYDRVSLTQAARAVLVPVLTLLRGPRI
ncbi:AAA domain-containing protein [Tessaracoccus defluvii]|uniref:AAA domain-containing protein n=1 Tax=Tessaracoccus defluvii TaxID=1285901 RepID=UPI0031D1B051